MKRERENVGVGGSMEFDLPPSSNSCSCSSCLLPPWCPSYFSFFLEVACAGSLLDVFLDGLLGKRRVGGANEVHLMTVLVEHGPAVVVLRLDAQEELVDLPLRGHRSDGPQEVPNLPVGRHGLDGPQEGVNLILRCRDGAQALLQGLLLPNGELNPA